jgi:hypothetical protein
MERLLECPTTTRKPGLKDYGLFKATKTKFCIQASRQAPMRLFEAMFGTAQRIGLADSPLTEDIYSSIEIEEKLEQLFNAGINHGQDKEDKEEDNQQDRKDKDENQTNDTSDETLQKKHDKKLYYMICEKESSGAHKCLVCNQFFMLFVEVTEKRVSVSDRMSLATCL